MIMRNIYLIAKQKDGDEAVLFEGSYSIPFFWLMLIRHDDVAAYRETLRRLPPSTPHEAPNNTRLRLDKLKALLAAASRRNYVKRHFTTFLPLYDDWIYFMQTSDFSDMTIYLDLHNILSSDAQRACFIDGLQKAIDGFEENRDSWYEDTIAGTCGYEGRNKNKRRFERFSKTYRDLNVINFNDKKIHLERKKTLGRLIPLIAVLLVLLTTAVLIYWIF
jgi:hypothetical protein